VTDLNWTPVSPLQKTIAASASIAANTGIHLTEVRDFAAVQVMARRGKWTDTAKVAKLAFGVAPANELKKLNGKNCTLIWSGPDQFLVMSAMRDRQPFADLGRKFSGCASLSEQTDGRALVSVTGPKVRDMLAKVCSLDLHPDVFPVGTAAVTAIDHLSTNIWRDEDSADGHATFYVLMLSTFAVSLWGLLVDSSAEYGVKNDTSSYPNK
jgi:methylglutamate dehydrogenase subunit D